MEPINRKKKPVSNNQPQAKVAVVPSNTGKVGTQPKGSIKKENQISLQIRELSFENNEAGNEKVLNGIKQMTTWYMNLINRLLSDNEKIKFNEKDSLETLIWKSASGVQKVYKARACVKFKGLLDENLLGTNENEKIFANAKVCWETLKWIFEKYFEYESDRNAFKDSEFEKMSHIMVEGIVPLLDNVIIDLEKIKEEYYLATFRIMMDPNRSCGQKNELTQDFFGYSLLDEDLMEEQMLYCSEHLMRDMACDFNKLQILLDCFNKLKQVPKTYSNMTKGCNVLKKCCDFYKVDLPNKLNGRMVMKAEFPLSSGKYYSDYINMCSYLQETVNKFLEILESAYSKNIDSLFDTPTQTPSKKQRQREKKNQQQLQRQQEQANQEAINKKSLTESSKTQATSEKDNSILDEEIKTPFELKEAIPTEPKEIEKKGSPIDFSLAKAETVYIEERNEEAIVLETNSLMEVMRQICEKDRKQKIIQQEEKRRLKVMRELELKKASLLEEKPQIIEAEKKIAFHKLSNRHEETLKALLSQKPPHLEISGLEVESLIKILNGKVEGDGNGSRLKVFWKGSDKQAGMYEVHGEHLTAPWAQKAGQAITEGIRYGLVVIDPLLLAKIEEDRLK